MIPIRWLLPLFVLSAACGDRKAPSVAAAAPGPRVEVVSKARTTDGEIQVRFRVVNSTSREIAYPGFAEDLPAFSVEYREGESWSPYALGWCGTGMLDFQLAPGAEMNFQAVLPADGKTYRASFGEPLVVTPPVVAEAN